MGLSKYEKETIILTNEEDSYYNIYTFNQKLQKNIRRTALVFKLQKKEVKLISSRRDGCR